MAAVVAHMVKNLSLGQEDHLEKWMATHFSILFWEIPWTEESDGLQSMCLQSQTQLSNWHFLSPMTCLKYPAPLLDWSKVPLFSSWKGGLSLPTCDEINTRCQKTGHSLGDVLRNWRPFHLTSPLPLTLYSVFDFSFSLLLSLWYIKEPGIQTQIRWLFWGASLPSSRSAGFPNKVVFLASTPHLLDSLACLVASRMSLDLVTSWLSQPGALLLVASWPQSGNTGIRP